MRRVSRLDHQKLVWAALVVSLAMLPVGACASEEAADQPASSVAMTTVAVVAESTTGVVATGWEGVPVIVLEETSSGEFRTGNFFAPFRFRMPDGWVAIFDEVDLVGFVPAEFGTDTGTVWFVDNGEPGTDATYDLVAGLPGAEVTNPEPAVVGAAPGVSYAVSVPVTQVLLTLEEEHLGHFWVEDGLSYAFRTVDVAGSIVTIITEGQPATFDSLEDQVGAFLDSVAWKEL